LAGGIDFRLIQVILKISLAGQIGYLHAVKVDQLEPGNTDSGQLKGNLPADGANTNNSCFAI
jgi:hypothetical protein